MGARFLEPAYLRDVEEKLAARAVVEHKKELLVIVKGIVEAHNEGTSHSLKDLALSPGVLDLLLLDDVLLFEDLHSE